MTEKTLKRKQCEIDTQKNKNKNKTNLGEQYKNSRRKNKISSGKVNVQHMSRVMARMMLHVKQITRYDKSKLYLLLTCRDLNLFFDNKPRTVY